MFQSNGNAAPFRQPTTGIVTGDAAISNNGAHVAYSARPDSTSSDQGVFRLTGGTVTTIIHPNGVGTYSAGAVDDAANVAFAGRRFIIGGGEAGIGSGGAVQYIVQAPGGVSTVSRPSLSSNGHHALSFTAGPTFQPSDYVRFNGTDIVRFEFNNPANRTTFTRTPFPGLPPVTSTIEDFSRPDVNAAGQVVFFADWGGNIADLLFRWDNATLTELGSFTPAHTIASVPAINDEGVVAVLVMSATTASALSLRAGLGAPTETLLSVGDAFMGSVVTDLDFKSEGLADSGGRLTFYAALADGRQGIYTVNIVPEPAALALVALATALLARRR